MFDNYYIEIDWEGEFMKFYVKTKMEMYIFLIVILIISLLLFMVPIFNSDQLKDRYKNYIDNDKLGNLEISDRNGEIIYDKGQFSSDKLLRESTFHLIGDKNKGITTSLLNEILNETKNISLFTGYSSKDEHLKLTIDSDLQKKAYSLLVSNEVNGTIFIVDYKIGEIICVTSTPSIDVNSNSKIIKEGSYINKAFYSYIPGSVFKAISVGCLIEKKPEIIQNYSYICTGKYKNVTCSQAHGKVNLEEALYKSCNCGISKAVSENISASELDEFVKQSRVLDSEIIENISIQKGNIKSNDDFAWTVNGQSKDLITPAGIAKYYASIANNGISKKMYFEINDDKEEDKRVLSENASNYLKDALTKGMKEWYGSPIYCNSFGKTGTAQINSQSSHSWFVCCLDDNEYPNYVIVTMLEKGGSSSLAKQITTQFINENIIKKGCKYDI